MEINGYYYFYELCKNNGFSAAAKKLYVTQPAVSYAISKLESQLGVKLIEKGAKKLTLTEYGNDLYKKLRDSFDNLTQIDSYVQNWQNKNISPITIATPEHIASILIIDRIVEFNKKYPDVKFNIISGPSKYLMDLFLNNEADILIDCTPIEFNKLKNYEIKPWSKQEFVLFCDKSLDIKHLDIKNIKNFKLVLTGENTNSTKMLMEALKEFALDINIQYYASTTDLQIKLVKDSQLIGYAMKDEVLKSEDFRILETNIELPTYDIYKIYSKHTDNHIAEFIELL